MKNIEIIDYSLLDLVAVVSTDSETPEPNTFTFNFTKGDVAAAAVELGIVSQPWDLDSGDRGQQFRIAFCFYAPSGETFGKPQYFTYPQFVEWISGEDREAIICNLAMQKPEISNQILQELI